ncbi:MAG: UDP-N-acetylmuramoyl-L-alanine--D-glutamate ligase [Cyanobacteria bacterium J06638_22]
MPQACVIGLGRSGMAAARLLQRQGWQVSLSDAGNSETLKKSQQALEAEGISVQLGHRFVPEASIARIVVSPGVPWDLPALEQARQQGIEVMGEMELAWQALKDVPWVGITGTNGKTTTTALVAAMFQAAGRNAPACGNIGFAACEVALNALQDEKLPDWVIAEVSSYQIESSASLAPQIGIWTTFTPDHLSRHYTLENYHRIKASLLRQAHQQVMNGDDLHLNQAAPVWADAHWTSVKGRASVPENPDVGAYVEEGWAIALGEPIVPVSALRMVGEHNQQNLLMAILAARLAGIEKEAIAHAVETFPGVSHRLEHITTWRDIAFINDSKATNYDAAYVGLSSVSAPAILIAGGDPKEGDDTAWLNCIRQKVAAIVLIGKAAPAFATRLTAVDYFNYEIVETLDRALPRSVQLAQLNDASVILLSPACASFDQYPSFEHRGEHFRQLCQAYMEDRT